MFDELIINKNMTYIIPKSYDKFVIDIDQLDSCFISKIRLFSSFEIITVVSFLFGALIRF